MRASLTLFGHFDAPLARESRAEQSETDSRQLGLPALGLLPPKSGSILEAVLYRGELPRGDAGTVVGTGERQARRIVSALLASEVLISESPRAPLALAFPAMLASRWMPGLFPEKSS